MNGQSVPQFISWWVQIFSDIFSPSASLLLLCPFEQLIVQSVLNLKLQTWILNSKFSPACLLQLCPLEKLTVHAENGNIIFNLELGAWTKRKLAKLKLQSSQTESRALVGRHLQICRNVFAAHYNIRNGPVFTENLIACCPGLYWESGLLGIKRSDADRIGAIPLIITPPEHSKWHKITFKTFEFHYFCAQFWTQLAFQG